VDFSAENRANISSALARMVLERGRAGGDREDGEGEEGGKYVGLLDGFVQSKTAFPVAERSHGQDAKLQVMDRRTGLMVQVHTLLLLLTTATMHPMHSPCVLFGWLHGLIGAHPNLPTLRLQYDVWDAAGQGGRLIRQLLRDFPRNDEMGDFS